MISVLTLRIDLAIAGRRTSDAKIHSGMSATGTIRTVISSLKSVVNLKIFKTGHVTQQQKTDFSRLIRNPKKN